MPVGSAASGQLVLTLATGRIASESGALQRQKARAWRLSRRVGAIHRVWRGFGVASTTEHIDGSLLLHKERSNTIYQAIWQPIPALESRA